MARKTGRFTHEEQELIASFAGKWTPEQIATKLERDVVSVRKYIKSKLGLGIYTIDDAEKYAECTLQSKPIWKDLEKQFTKEELEMFSYHWKRIAAQFRDDITPTEEWQIIDAIKLEIMMNRIMVQQKQSGDNLSNIEKLIQEEKDKELPDVSMISALQGQLLGSMQSMDTMSRELRELLAKKNSILKEMKATRSDRKKHIEESSKNFPTWLSQVLTNTELRKNLGLQMEKMRLAVEKEEHRLSQYHTYVDKAVDIPFLNHEVVEGLEE